MNKLLLVFVISITVANCETVSQRATSVFHNVDGNKDDKLVQSEFDGYLKKFDPDGDASMTLANYMQLLSNKTSLPDATKQFNFYDKNHDHVLDLKDSHLIFKMFDEDGDGSVTMKEFKDNYVGALVSPDMIQVGK